MCSTPGADNEIRSSSVTATQFGLLAAMFGEARTFSHWQVRPVSEAIVETAFELACLGPTSANCQPLRLVLVRSPEAKERLLACVSSGNYEKVRTAPVTAAMAGAALTMISGLEMENRAWAWKRSSRIAWN